MAKVGEKAKRVLGAASGAVTAARGVYEIAVSVEGRPVKERLKPAKIRILGVPVFERDSQLDRWWFGLIRRGKSKAARAALERDDDEVR